MELKEYCSRYRAPNGWKFQDCKDDIITLVRTRKEEDWEVDYSGEEIPKDAYVSAEKFENYPSEGLSAWEVTDYTPGSSHTSVRTWNRRSALQEIKCTAISLDVWDECWGKSGCLEKTKNSLNKCRDKYGGVHIFLVH